MPEPRTIDNLGAQPHQQYVDWQREKEDIAHLLEEIPVKTQIQVSQTLPYEIEKIIKETGKKRSFAIFQEDKNLFPTEVFSTNTIESIGSSDDIAALLNKPNLPKPLKDFLQTLLTITKNQNDIDAEIKKYLKS